MGAIETIYQNALKPQLFKKDPEDVHDRFISVGSKMGRNTLFRSTTKKLLRFDHESLVQEVDGITYSNPIGLSAGFDKDANLHNILYPVGFGYMQVGSVTFKPYEGNPKPRLHRLPNSKGLVVYYGLKNDGVEVISEKLQVQKDPEFPLSISIAKTNCDSTSTTQGGIDDYVGSLKYLEEKDLGDLYTINISCPNTFGGEPFTTGDKLNQLFTEIDKLEIHKPIYVKMPINLQFEKFDELLDVIVDHELNGIIIGNLNKERTPELIKDPIPEGMNGGISGKPTEELSNALIKHSFIRYGEKLTIVGTGGVFTADDAYRKIKLGSSLVQLITGMIYGGPQVIGDINRGLVKMLQQDGYATISEAVGVDAR